MRQLAETAAPLAWRRRRARIIADVAPDVPAARTDEALLEQIVGNLIGNAVRHTPPGGMVAASVDAEDGSVRVDVRDTGEGMAVEDVARIFERFYRGPASGASASGGAGAAREEHDGVGLGLALVKELTHAMGGTVEVSSAPGEGSCFTVRLPRA